jgi:hypothetical protein
MTNSTNSTLDCEWFSGTILGQCSGHGACLDLPTPWQDGKRGFCECDSGWTGVGDMIDATGLDCMTNTAVAKWWWFAIGVVNFLLLFQQLSVWVPMLKEKGIAGLQSNRLLQTCILCFVFSACRCVETFLRVSTGEYVGQSMSISVMSFIAGFVFWGFLANLFFTQIVDILVKSMKMSGPSGDAFMQQLVGVQKLMKMQVPMVAVAYVSAFATVLVENPFVQQWLIFSYYFFSTITSIFFVYFIALPVTKAFLKIIKEANPDGSDVKMAALEGKIAILVREFTNNGFTNTFTCVAMLLPFTRTWVSYQLALGWTIGALIVGIAVLFIAPNKKKKSAKVGATAATTVVTSTSDEN